MKHTNWTEQEVELAIELYVLTPFGKIHSRNPDIILLANKIGRTPSAVALKLSNFAALDETIDRKGMANASKLDRLVWGRFFNELKAAGQLIQNENETDLNKGFDHPSQQSFTPSMNAGTTVRHFANARVGQAYFRKMILATYDHKCAITGIDQAEFLVAGHIRSWASDIENRMNPSNGICLNRLHDKAFENRLITIRENNEILYSNKLKPITRQRLQSMNDEGVLKFPKKFRPDPAFLEEHRDQFFFHERTS